MVTNLAICCLTSDQAMLYFIKSGDYCKVGYTKDSVAFFERMRKYLTHNPSFQVLDIRKGDMITEKKIHTLIPDELYHYGEWCVWDKRIAQIWMDYYEIKKGGARRLLLYKEQESKQGYRPEISKFAIPEFH